MTGAPAFDHRQVVRAKMTKWAMFTVGLVLVTIAADVFSFLANRTPLTLSRLFGRGELFMVSIGLLIAASADLVFDRLVRGGGRIYHGVVLSFCLLMIPLAVAYGSSKAAAEPAPLSSAVAGDGARAAPDERGREDRRAALSLYVLLGSVVLSGLGVYLSERGRDGR
ncbi:MAG TPA: hypothetical protein VGD67_00050 [Pseudonocardiaceae bacterium]